MSAGIVISTVDNITLVTLVGFPAQVDSLSRIFDSIAKYEINIDMISMAPTHGAFTGLSFTCTLWDMVSILSSSYSITEEIPRTSAFRSWTRILARSSPVSKGLVT